MSKHLGRGKKRRMTKYAIDEIAAVPYGSQETARALILKVGEGSTTKRVRKSVFSTDDIRILKDSEHSVAVVITSEEEGHTHALYLYPGNLGGETSYGHAEGEESSHDHPWAFDGNGGITIGANAGHDHEIDPATVFQAVMSIQKGMTKRKLATILKDGIEISEDTHQILSQEDLIDAIQSFSGAIDQEESADYIRESALEIDAEDLVPESGALAFTDDQPAERIGKESKMAAKTELEKAQASIAKLEARAARADSIVDLNDNYRPYFKGLDTKGQDSFLAMGGDERSEAVSVFDKAKTDADPVIFKSADGTQYLKSDDPRMVKMARERDEDRDALRKAQDVAENATFVKRAEAELPNTPGDAEVGAAVLKALETIPEDDGLRGRAYLMVKAGDNALSGVFTRHGTTAVDPANDPASVEKQGASGKLDQIVKARMEKDSISEADAYVAVLDTPEGSTLYDQATN